MKEKPLKHNHPWRVDLPLVLLLLIVLTQVVLRPTGPHPLVGRDAPGFILEDHHGRAVAVPSGRVALVQFQPARCRTCPANRKVLDLLQRMHGRQVQVITVTEPGPGRLAHAGHLEVHDVGARVSRQYGTTGQPLTVLIGKEGKVLWVHRGAFTSFAAREALKRVGLAR
ncbi:TlpA family protein disulfide reductase [Deinococcus cellulosilyticus]|uniref:Thioredoxin domain-containing protein n=1 Tax=Deinococcus cellulosilyticus (strain DSM 18568 / NBRC 106333 / KACC 11606 / 5516J-15) TaxID=1223518 RepID=A0A511N2G8_DEIC1|nr:hypothetical protein [Deinococcus cellulosilyticus]GEM46707.1 hypothetical protein DC3_23420 [Deinococcus cellulosilyticus NBRC 106333 = KACC 11606]